MFGKNTTYSAQHGRNPHQEVIDFTPIISKVRGWPKARIERSSHKAAFGRTQRSGQSAIDNRSQIRASGHKWTPKRLVSTRILLSSFG